MSWEQSVSNIQGAFCLDVKNHTFFIGKLIGGYYFRNINNYS